MTYRNYDAPPPSTAYSRIAAVGDLIDGKFQVQKILGRGGMGIVVAALHIHLQEQVALKILLPSKSTDRESRARFLREARITARLQNEHVASVMDVGMLESGSPYFVMEYLEGSDLKRLLAVRGQLEVPVAVNYVAQACEGIAEAHARKVLHRDLKPSNLFLTKRYDGSDLIKVLDFGVSKVSMLGPSDDSYHTEAGTVLGSPAYMSPERLNDLEVDVRADVWSLAIILYELLTGRPPFWHVSQAVICSEVLGWKPATPIREHRPDVPIALEAAIARALDRDVETRTPNVAELVADILQAVPDDPRASDGISLRRIRGALGQASLSDIPAVGRLTGEQDKAAAGADNPTVRPGFLAQTLPSEPEQPVAPVQVKTATSSRTPWVAIGVAIAVGVTAAATTFLLTR